ncbi:MAG TPA: hypothetical protein VFJ58_26850 [Armatimonadota bacterium]|nr:hypothetical protein [Armatimonadota bacterium]
MSQDFRSERVRRFVEGEQPGGVSGQTALLALLAVIVAAALLYQLLNWRPSSVPRPLYYRGPVAQIRG